MFSGNEKKQLRVEIPEETVDVLERMKSLSTHGKLTQLLSEAIGVAATIYEYSVKNNKEVHCRVENGKIWMYTDDGDGDDGEPIPVDMNNLVELFKKAA